MINKDIFEWQRTLASSAGSFLERINYSHSGIFKAVEGFKTISPIYGAAAAFGDIERIFPHYSAPQINVDYFQLNQIALDSQRIWLESLNPIANFFDNQTYWLSIPETTREDSQEDNEPEPQKLNTPPVPALIWRIGLELMQKVIQDERILFQISDREFEILTGDLFHSNGFTVELTPKSKDGGKDLVVTKIDAMGLKCRYLVECKRYAPHHKVGVEIVRSLHGTVDYERANGGVIVTTSTFTRPAIEWATEFKSLLQLKDFNDLQSWLRAFKA